MDHYGIAVDAWLTPRASARAINKVVGDRLAARIAELKDQRNEAGKAYLRLDQWVRQPFVVRAP